MKIFLTLIILIILTILCEARVSVNRLTDQQVIALTLWGEARGEGMEGLKAVASVIVNRKAKYGTLRKVALAPYQFSVWNGKRQVTLPRDKTFLQCERLAGSMLSGTFRPRHGFRYYYNPALCCPGWARQAKASQRIGSHVFLNV